MPKGRQKARRGLARLHFSRSGLATFNKHLPHSYSQFPHCGLVLYFVS